jgi:hypothetical protein
MGHIRKTTAGQFRACWRDPAGKQRSKTFPTRREASAHLAAIERSMVEGVYVSPTAGKIRLREFAEVWQQSRRSSARHDERVASILARHILPVWGDWPLGRIDHMSVQRWVTGLGERMAPLTVYKVLGVLRRVLRAAIRTRRIGEDPTVGVESPKNNRRRQVTSTVSLPSTALWSPRPAEPDFAGVSLRA